MEFKFTLSYQQVKSALLLTGQIKPYLLKSIIQATVAFLSFIWYLTIVLQNPDYKNSYVIMALMLLVIAAVFILPKKIQHNIITTALIKAQIVLLVQKDKITVNVDEHNARWDITCDMVADVLKNCDVYVIVLNDSRAVIIPKSVVNSSSEKQQLKEFLDEIKR